jgi:cell fate (sporulation/competence/biofilm development) regulator YmcA (YheA/YmcA/DUF963 family)
MTNKMETKVTKIAVITASVAIILLVASTVFNFKMYRNIQTLNQKYLTLEDSLIKTQNDLKQETTTVKVLTAENEIASQELNAKSTEITKLRNLVAKYEKEIGKLNTAIIVSNQTITTLKDSLHNTIVGYTSVPTDTSEVVYPIYSRDFEREWDKGSVTMGLDVLDLSITTRNAYDITIGKDKLSPFKDAVYANITNLNPNTETKTIKVYQKEPVKNRTVQKAGAVGIIGFIIGLLIN